MIDLHSHSIFSDGSETPEKVVELAAQAGCSTLALTDHDGLDGIARARIAAAENGVNLISGCEVSCMASPGSMHVLCYFIEPKDGPLQDELGRLSIDRQERNEELIARLNSIGFAITLEEVAGEAKGSTIGRPHFAAVMVKKQIVSSIGAAFDRYLGKGAAAYVGKARVGPETIIHQTIASGGIAVMAHPLTLGLSMKDLDHKVGELADAGLGGLESYYSRYDDETRGELAKMATRHGLVATGGSDFHGSYKPDIQMGKGTGDLCVPDEVIDALVAKREELQLSR